MGGPVGGWMADRWGWRFAFSAQVPLLVGSLVLMALFVPGNIGRQERGPWLSKLAQIDYLGTLLLGTSVGSLLLGVSLKTAATHSDGTEFRWSDPLIATLLATFAVSLLLFLAVEEWWASQPVLPLSLMSRRTPFFVGFANLTMAMAVFSMLYNVPLWFITVQLMTASNAGMHLLPYSVLIGFGSLMVGYYMRRTARYWGIMVVSGLIVTLSCASMLTFDRYTPDWLQWIGPSPAGFGYAGVLTSTLVALMTDVQQEGKGEIAVATAMTYMFRTIGQVLGVSFSSALLQSSLDSYLAGTSLPADTVELIRKNTNAISHLPKHTRDIAVDAYSSSLHKVFVMNFVLSALTVVMLASMDNVDMSADRRGGEDEND